MEKDEEFLYGYFNYIAQLCFDKAKEHVEKEKDNNGSQMQIISWPLLLSHLQQLALAEKSYMEIGFLQSKNKGFLRKDNSLRAVYDSIKQDLKRIQEMCKDKKINNHYRNIEEFITARITLMDFYDKIFLASTARSLKYSELLEQVQEVIEKSSLTFTDISMTPIKAVFSLECAILEQLLKALLELQRLQFLPSLALIHGAHTRLGAWENKIHNRETWKLGFLKTNQLPALFQWHLKLKGAVLSKFSLFFHDTLALQTSTNEMRQLCSKLHHDYYYKMSSFQKKYDAVAVFLLSDNQVSCDTTAYDCFPIIVTCPARPPAQLEVVLKMIADSVSELTNIERSIYKYSSQDKTMFVLTTVEPNIYLVLIFENKKTEKDVYINNFVSDLCTNLRCTKIFANLKSQTK